MRAFDDFQKFYSSRTTYFLGYDPYQYSWYDFLEQNPQFKKESIHFLNYCNYPMMDESNYNNPNRWDICKLLFGPKTVIYCAIQVAAYMGFNRIYLLGCDHDYLKDVTRITNHHFYTEEESGMSDVEHLSAFDTERWFIQYYYRWKHYRLMNEYLTSKGCNIFNATNGGMLDVFPRVRFEDVISNKNK
jgi:hypothetical protein